MADILGRHFGVVNRHGPLFAFEDNDGGRSQSQVERPVLAAHGAGGSWRRPLVFTSAVSRREGLRPHRSSRVKERKLIPDILGNRRPHKARVCASGPLSAGFEERSAHECPFDFEESRLGRSPTVGGKPSEPAARGKNSMAGDDERDGIPSVSSPTRKQSQCRLAPL